jgi:predicted nucleic acid-binding protein
MLFDTNILIDYLRGRQQAIDLLSTQIAMPKVSVVSTLELYAGVRTRREEQKMELLFSQASLLPVTQEIAKRAGVFIRLYQASHSVEMADALVAATAEYHGLRLATLNAKHFPMFPKLKRPY